MDGWASLKRIVALYVGAGVDVVVVVVVDLVVVEVVVSRLHDDPAALVTVPIGHSVKQFPLYSRNGGLQMLHCTIVDPDTKQTEHRSPHVQGIFVLRILLNEHSW